MFPSFVALRRPERVRTPRSCLLRCGLLAAIAPVALDVVVKRRLALRNALLQNPAWILPRAFAGCRVDQLPLLAADAVARFPNNIPIVHAFPLEDWRRTPRRQLHISASDRYLSRDFRVPRGYP